MAIIECVHPSQHQVQQSEHIPMDEKNSRSRRWEFSSTLGGQSAGPLVDPNTSSPSMCKRRFVKDDPNV
jgi:hypothetical protein